MRMRFSMPFGLFALVILAGLLWVGCDRKTDTTTTPVAKQLTSAVIPKGTTHSFWQSIRAGAETAGKELDCKIFWTGPEREGDRERQIQIVEDVIAQKVDAVVLAPLDSRALVPSVRTLRTGTFPA